MTLLMRSHGSTVRRLTFLSPQLQVAHHLHSSAKAAAAAPGFFELRQSEVRPPGMRDFSDLVKSHPITAMRPRGIWTTDVGESMTRVYHLYHWIDYNERDKQHAAFRQSAEFSDVSRRMADSVTQESCSIFAEATPMLAAVGLPGMLDYAVPASASSPPSVGVYELRKYQLKLGYTTVPRFLELYQEGLVDKLAADKSGQSELVSLLHSEAGAAPLNTVIELWRHTSLQGSQISRAASRAAPVWRKAVGDIAELAVTFNTQFLRPTEGSPLQ